MNCLFEGCSRAVSAKGMCHTHYNQEQRNGRLKPIRDMKRLHMDEEGRVCTTCLEYKPWSEFYRMSKTSSTQYDGYRAKCKVCSRIKEKEHREARQAGAGS